MKNILSLVFLCMVSCKNNTKQTYENSHPIVVVENKKVTIVNQDAKTNIFDGLWSFESLNNNDSLQNITFEINLYCYKKVIIKGNYCSVSRNGNKIDCFEENDPNISGKIVQDTLYVNFKSNWENSKGEAKLYFLNKNELYWKIIKSEGELYLPDYIVLKRSK